MHASEKTETDHSILSFIVVTMNSFIVVAMNSTDQYEIIWLRKISHYIKQPCRNVCLEKAL